VEAISLYAIAKRSLHVGPEGGSGLWVGVGFTIGSSASFLKCVGPTLNRTEQWKTETNEENHRECKEVGKKNETCVRKKSGGEGREQKRSQENQE